MPHTGQARGASQVRDQAADWDADHSGPFLLDVNVLIALIDTMHNQHIRAHDWLRRYAGCGWGTCPLTENGVLRIVGHTRYHNPSGSPAACAASLASLCGSPGHQFWPGELSLLRSALIDVEKLRTPAQITDTWLLALAVHHGGQLASFDRRLVTSAVRGGAAALHLI